MSQKKYNKDNITLSDFALFCKLNNCSSCRMIDLVKYDEYKSGLRVLRQKPGWAAKVVADFLNDMESE